LYEIIDVPEDAPVTVPDPSTVAIDGRLLLQVPPGLDGVNREVLNEQITDVPVITPGTGNESICSTSFALLGPQLLISV
jgi:hypothetical protein